MEIKHRYDGSVIWSGEAATVRTEEEWRELRRAYMRRNAHCRKFGVPFVPTADEKEAQRRYGARYAATERGRAVLRAGQRKYRASAHGREAMRSYQRSESRKAAVARYGKTPKGRLVRRRAQAKYRGYAAPLHSDVEPLITAQGGRCAICGDAFTNQLKPHLDHCHSTGAVRGALCGGCNSGIGMFRDDPERLKRAAEYLLGTDGKFRLKRMTVVGEKDLKALGLEA